MLYEQDLDAESAIKLLEISFQDLEYIVKRLLQFKILEHISSDEVKLTDNGINYLMKLYGM